MRRFVGASALALAVSILTVGARSDTVDSNDKVVSAAKAGQDGAPSPYLINHTEVEADSSRPPSQHDVPQSVPLPGAAWAGIAMMGGLLIGRHMIRRRRRLV